jgi:hypothetical protein
MSVNVILYWKQRLLDGCPFAEAKLLKDDCYCLFSGEDRTGWPEWVSTDAIYNDYLTWMRNTHAEMLKDKPPYATRPWLITYPRMPRRNFFVQMAPLLYVPPVTGPTLKRIKKPQYYQGSWFKVKVYQRFIKLNTRDVHIDTFKCQTGQQFP